MAVDQQYLTYVLEQLSEVPEFSHKKMFGGIGFMCNGAMFGAIMNAHDTLRLKATAETQGAYEEAGMEPFMMEKMNRTMPYWTVPKAVVADKKQLAEWVRIAIEAVGKDKK